MNSAIFHSAVNEWRSTTKNQQKILDIHDIVQIVLDFHPYNQYFWFETMNPVDDMIKFDKIRNNYFECFNYYNIKDYVEKEYEDIIRRVKFVKKFIDIFFVSISPPPSDKPNVLIDFVKKLLARKNITNIYGVFELGSKSNLFHCHFLMTPAHKDEMTNLKNLLTKKGYIFDIAKIPNKLQLLKTLRYMHKQEKLNQGFINKPDFELFEILTDDKAPIKFIISEKNIIINKL